MAMENERREEVDTKGKKAETKHEKFLRLSSCRVNSAVKYIDNLVPLANATNYDYTADEVAQIFAHLRRTVDNAESAFNVSLHKKNSGKGLIFR
jgi:hypothetical protein